jgi:hypothetical protein
MSASHAHMQVCTTGFRVSYIGFRKSRVSGFVFRVSGFEKPGFGYWVSGFDQRLAFTKPQTRNPVPCLSRNPKPETLYPVFLETSNPKPYILLKKPGFVKPVYQLYITKPQRSRLVPGFGKPGFGYRVSVIGFLVSFGVLPLRNPRPEILSPVFPETPNPKPYPLSYTLSLFRAYQLFSGL